MHTEPPIPIVIIGGFASRPSLYREMAAQLTALSGRPILTVPIRRRHWLAVALSDSYRGLLRRVDATVQAAYQAAGNRRVTIVAHSAGGVLARIYLADQPYRGTVYAGARYAAELIMLGTPQQTARRGRIGGLNQIAWAQQHVPAAYCRDVRYTSVIGAALTGRADGTPAERAAFQSYRLISGDGAQAGDGVVPLDDGLLAGARQLTLPAVRHDPRFDGRWYAADRATVASWWLPTQSAAD
jgi:pimeloyl-ACP methyl ester carboxylesterase